MEDAIMKGILITHKGMENTAAKELREILGRKAEIEERVIIFSAKMNELCKVAYMSRAAERVLALIEIIEFKELEDIKISDKYKEWLKKSFVVRCQREGEHNFSSLDVERHIGAQINSEVDLNNPDIIFFAFINKNKLYFCVDLSGFDLSKRDYKIFNNRDSIKGTIAFHALKVCGYKSSEVLLDPFSKDGVIVIEAALYASNQSVNYFRKDKFAFNSIVEYEFFDNVSKPEGKIISFDNTMQGVTVVKKNAKIAEVESSIDIRKVNIDWLDIKLEKSSVDCIVSYPPQPAKHKLQPRELVRMYEEFFYQSDYVLKEQGRICLISRSTNVLKQAAYHYKFKLQSESEVMQGKQKLYILLFSRQE